MVLKEINQYSSALIRLTKTKFPTLVTSNTDESHGLGAIGTVKYNALSGISVKWKKLGEAQKAETPQSEEQTDMHVAKKKNDASRSQKSGSCNENQQRKKRSTYIIGDFMVKDVKGWELKKSCRENENIL